MTSFDHVVPTTLRICQSAAGFDVLKLACLVRDLQGRVRLVVDPGEEKALQLDLDSLAATLTAELGGYFAPPILPARSGTADQRRLARSVLDQATAQPEKWPAAWPNEVTDPITGVATPRLELWCGLQRCFSKELWLAGGTVDLPWPRHERTPAIVTFYSFKGGVGRSTLLGCLAASYARDGKRVAVIDLDLEAPGAGTLFDAHTERGVIDFVVDVLATDTPSLAECSGAADALGSSLGALVDVIPAAGRLDWAFIEKLARLDYAGWGPGAEEESPVGKAIRSLLKEVKRQLKPDIIFLDSRSGLHDLGGLSLHSLAHVDVLVARNNPQDLAGLRIALQALVRRKSQAQLDCVIVHSLAPLPADRDPGVSERAKFRSQVYDIFRDVVYTTGDDQPDENADTAAHYPRVFGRFAGLERLQTLADMPEEVFQDAELQELRRRIDVLCRPVEDDQNDGDGGDEITAAERRPEGVDAGELEGGSQADDAEGA